MRWVDGQRYGDYRLFDEDGNLYVSGEYRRNKKNKVWVNHKTNDTTWYVKGEAYNEHPRIIKRRNDSLNGKRVFFERIFGKKDTTNINKKGFFQRIFKKKDSSGRKNSFFHRLFNKKDSTKASN